MTTPGGGAGTSPGGGNRCSPATPSPSGSFGTRVMADLFDDDMERSQYGTIPVNRTVPERAIPRLSRQCQMILDRLRRGRVTNRELASISLKYTGRLSEIRQAGFDVRVMEQDHATGLAVYALLVGGAEVEMP